MSDATEATAPESGDAAERLRRIEAELQRLREENARLRAEVDRKPDATAAAPPPSSKPDDDYDEFIAAEGVLWKRGADGRPEKLVYCPKCRLVLLAVPADNPRGLVCTRCKFRAPFGPAEATALAARLDV